MTDSEDVLTRVIAGRSVPADRVRVQQSLAHWIREAYRLGDDSYLDFAGGRRLYPAAVRYETMAPADGETA